MRKDCVPVVVVDAFGNKYTVENDELLIPPRPAPSDARPP